MSSKPCEKFNMQRKLAYYQTPNRRFFQCSVSKTTTYTLLSDPVLRAQTTRGVCSFHLLYELISSDKTRQLLWL